MSKSNPSPEDPISESLRTAIRGCGYSPYALEKETGVLQVSIRRFLAGEARMRIDNVDKICRFLGYRLSKKDD